MGGRGGGESGLPQKPHSPFTDKSLFLKNLKFIKTMLNILVVSLQWYIRENKGHTELLNLARDKFLEIIAETPLRNFRSKQHIATDRHAEFIL